jgi:hypothetical protein
MGKYIRHLIAVMIGGLIAATVQFIGSRWGVTFEDEAVKNFADAATNTITPVVMLAVYAVLEKFFKRFPSLDPEGYAGRELVNREAAAIALRKEP